MSNPSLWREAPLPQFGPVETDDVFDVAIVGGGIAGLTAALLLKESGQRVCVLERERIGAVETGNTSAHVTYVTDRRLSGLARTFGRDAARLAWLGGAEAIRTIHELSDRIGSSCGFQHVAGCLHLPLCCEPRSNQKDEIQSLEEEARLADELGFEARFVERVDGLDVPGVVYARQAQFHPLLHLAALAQAVEGGGCRVFEQSAVTQTEDEPLAVWANGHRIACRRIALMTHVPLMGNAGTLSAGLLQSKIAAYTSYAVSARTRHGRIPLGLYSDTDDPYRYLRVVPHEDYDEVILGGEDHKTGQADDADARYLKLEGGLLKLLPDAVLDHRWCGQVLETPDGLPYIGETAPGQFAATGFAGNGMTWGTLAGMMACDYVLERPNPWSDLLSPRRVKVLGSALRYMKENLDYPYYFVRDKLSPAEGDSLDELQPGQGKILNLEGKKAACFREENGHVHAVSAECTHMGCQVHFNAGERTWDCPCHGSRFHVDGSVSTGPAESPLEAIHQPAASSGT